MKNRKANYKRNLVLLGVTAFTLVAATGCRQLDAIGNGSVKSFDKVLNAVSDNITEEKENSLWSLSAPDDSARFLWSQDFSKTKEDTSLEIDAEPFIEAGLDISLLPEGMLKEDKIILGTDFGDNALTYKGEITPLASYKQIVNLNRKSIGYHAALDHYGINVGNGNMFEWAKDMSKNDKDIVFVLNPKVFIDAGVNPENVKGWVFAKVETMDDSGKKIQVDKFLKPFDLQ